MTHPLIVDAHLDLAWNACDWNRDLSLPVAAIRAFERPLEGAFPGDCTVSWPELRRGHVGLVVATLLPRLFRKQEPLSFFQSREAAYGACHGQWAYYRAMVLRNELRPILSCEDLDAHLEQWHAAEPHEPPIGFILSMEGAWPILWPEQVEDWHDQGLRIVGPAHYGPNPYCHGTGSEGGLTSDGRTLLREMDRVGMILDVTHLADQSFWEALELFQGPVLASHHNCRALVPGDRQLSDEQIQALVQRDAVIGASFDCWMLQPGWKSGHSDPKTVSLQNVADHIDHICQLAGSARFCGIGSDLDGGFGKEQTPHDIDTIADLQKLGDTLSQRGYKDDDVDRILCRNWIGYFRRALASS